MKIAIASDHGGFNLKKDIIEHLTLKNIEFFDFGTYENTSCDYPVFAKKVAEAILEQKYERGILICGTGVGMAIAANRYEGIRAVNANNIYSAKMSRLHNDSNVLTLGERVTGKGLALEIVDTWLETKFDGGRHQKRIDMIDGK